MSIYLSLYLIPSTIIWCGTHNRAGLQFKCVLADNPPSPGEVGQTSRVYIPYSGVGSFMSHENQISESAVRKDLHVRFFCPYTRRLESLTVRRCQPNRGCINEVPL